MAFAVSALCGSIDGQMFGALFVAYVKCHFSRVDVMVYLLGNHDLVGWQVELVTATSILVGGVVFESEFGVVGGAHERAHSHGA